MFRVSRNRTGDGPPLLELAGDNQRSPTRQWTAPILTVLGVLVAEFFGATPTGLGTGLFIIVGSVVVAVPIAGTLSTAICATIGAVYFAYFVPIPQGEFAAGFMRFVPGLFALPPIFSALRPLLERAATRAEGELPAPAARELEVEHVLQEAGALTDASFSYQATLDRISRLPLPLLADWVVVYELPDSGHARRVGLAADGGAAEDALQHAFASTPLRLNGQHPLALVDEVLRTGQPQTVTEAAAIGLETVGREQGERLLLHRLEPASIVMTPLHARGRLLGAMVFARTRGHPPYDDADARTLLEYSRRAALAVDNARLFDSAMSARAEAESARERLLAILDDLSSGFIALDHDGRVTHMNQAAERLTSRSRQSLLGRNLWQELPPYTTTAPFARFAMEAGSRHATSTTELSVSWTGEARWLEVNVAPSREGVSLYMRDVTERREMASALQAKEEELRQSQKMEAVGRLAGGVAHDFNNLLMSIAGYAELLLNRAGPDHNMAPDLQEILRSTERASSLTRQLLTYSRKQMHQPQLCNLAQVVSEMQRSLLRLLGEDIVLVVNSDPDLAAVFVDPAQIEQILLNLAVNSRDAMHGGGTLTIALANVEFGTGRAEQKAGIEPGRYVALEVTDTGVGIEPALMPHIFEPFFTTKASGKGTGLGLSSVYGIVKQNRGSISVTSVPGRGTTFRVLFAAAEGTENQLTIMREIAAAPTQPATAPVVKEKASGVILVAEDENSVRRFVCEVLRERGYTVLEASTGVEGVAVAKRHTGQIDLVLTDVVMPEMGGRGLAEHIMQERPGTRILFMSGYAEDEIAHHGVLASGVQMLEKPFSAAILLERVRTVLAAPPAIVRFSGTSAA